MEAKEIMSRVKALNKLHDEKGPEQEIISTLESLKKGVVITEDLLRNTKAGIVVAKFRNHPNQDGIAKLANEIVFRWRKQVDAAREKQRMMSKAQKSSPPKGGYIGDTAKRTWEADQVDIKRTGLPVRDACVGLVYNGLAFMSKENCDVLLIRAIEVEAAAHEVYKGETPEYKSKLRSLFQNLKQKGNRDLGLRVMSGEIPAEKFVVMTHDELKSQERRKEDEKLNEENMKNAHVPKAELSVSDALQCSKCKNWKCSYTQAQTRSADEPMTTFAECLVCGNKWKFS